MGKTKPTCFMNGRAIVSKLLGTNTLIITTTAPNLETFTIALSIRVPKTRHKSKKS